MALGCNGFQKYLAIVVLACVFCAPCAAHYRRSHRYEALLQVKSGVQEQWFTQRLDHFSGADTRVWKQRYFVNDSFYRPGGPVFLMIGGEGPANPTWMQYGTWLLYAQKLGALCLLLEHRFYGKSHPTEDLSTANLRFLSSRQALADLAHFRTVTAATRGLTSSKWVAFGGSYPGSLAAWFRLKYPHLVHASVATSAPVHATVNFPVGERVLFVQSVASNNAGSSQFALVVTCMIMLTAVSSGLLSFITLKKGEKGQIIGLRYRAYLKLNYEYLSNIQCQAFEYLEVVWRSLAAENPECPLLLKKASDTLVDRLNDPKTYDNITNDFGLCSKLQIQSKMDSAYLLESLAGNFMDVVQYNEDNRAFEGAVGTNITIKVLCSVMLDSSLGEPYNRYAAVARLMQKTFSQPCINTQYKSYIQDMSNTSWSGPEAGGGRQWVYQTCTEFGFYQSTDSPNQPFNGFPLPYHLQQCADIYNLSTLLDDAIQQTNEEYGGYDIRSTRIVFPNGSIDPWHALGVTQDITSDLLAVFIKGTAHCANMYPARAEDLPQLGLAREHIFILLQKWLAE
ncbi:Thymus-specific serine protease [Anabarilius grahami]|uniref:Thymus-specific serine protease n=1 Tax=Anabarilius grahami TaxID=495550 RepID=A0A3N0XQY6_ANAGA|nr:Thymus-specific serine protease [Anabarilius grahami]